MSLVVVVCGDRWKETLVLLKSALLFTKGHLQFYIFTDKELIDVFKKEVAYFFLLKKKNFVRILQFKTIIYFTLLSILAWFVETKF